MTLADTGCCTSCEGTGWGGPGAGPETNGRCWDCRGTGHLRDGPCPVPIQREWCEDCDEGIDVADQFDEQIGYEEQARPVWVVALSCGHQIVTPSRWRS